MTAIFSYYYCGMNTIQQIRDLSDSRLKSAEALYKNGQYDDAFYLAGYCVELELKAKCCERWGIPNLFDETAHRGNETVISEVRKALKTHNLRTLLIFSCLKERFEVDKATNKSLSLSNSLLWNRWTELIRYKPCGEINKSECQGLLQLLKTRKGIIQWIRTS